MALNTFINAQLAFRRIFVMLCLPIVNINQLIKIVIKYLSNGIKPHCVASQKQWKKARKISGILEFLLTCLEWVSMLCNTSVKEQSLYSLLSLLSWIFFSVCPSLLSLGCYVSLRRLILYVKFLLTSGLNLVSCDFSERAIKHGILWEEVYFGFSFSVDSCVIQNIFSWSTNFFHPWSS